MVSAGTGITIITPIKPVIKPADFLARSALGFWFDAQDMSTMFQLSGGTTAPVVGSPVGFMSDKSGHANTVTQATAAARPTLKSGTIGQFLEFDGVAMRLNSAAFNLAIPWTRFTLIRQLSWVANATLLGSLNTAGRLQQSGVSPQLRMFDASANSNSVSPALNVDAVIVERHGGAANSRISVNRNTIITSNPGVTVASGISLGSAFGNSNFGNFRMYESIMIGAQLLDTEVQAFISYFENKYHTSLS